MCPSTPYLFLICVFSIRKIYTIRMWLASSTFIFLVQLHSRQVKKRSVFNVHRTCTSLRELCDIKKIDDLNAPDLAILQISFGSDFPPNSSCLAGTRARPSADDGCIRCHYVCYTCYIYHISTSCAKHGRWSRIGCYMKTYFAHQNSNVSVGNSL